MLRVFNCGIGLTLIVSPEDEATALRHFADLGWAAWGIGEIVHQPVDRPATWVE